MVRPGSDFIFLTTEHHRSSFLFELGCHRMSAARFPLQMNRAARRPRAIPRLPGFKAQQNVPGPACKRWQKTFPFRFHLDSDFAGLDEAVTLKFVAILA